MARALAATAAVGRDRLLPVEAGPGDRISRHVGYFGAARNFRRGASGGPECSEIGFQLMVGVGRSAAFARAEDRGMARAGKGYDPVGNNFRSEENTSELQSLMRNSYTVFCL